MKEMQNMNQRDSSESTALIIIDMQRDFCVSEGYAAKAGVDVQRLSSVISNIRALLDTARQARFLVIHTREGHLPDLSDCHPAKLLRSELAGAPIGHKGPMGRLLIRGEYGHDIIDELKPMDGEIIIDKPGYGSFYHTNLEALLEKHGIHRIILCGVTTEVCVHSTLREAVDRGYQCITVGDACAASNPELQQAALDIISVEGRIFGRVMTTEEVCTAISRHTLNSTEATT
ncbi:cysteine hydrolase [Nitrosospira sp. NRS527]|uniref:cysteine hydrolase family protein n=1 Tax=Nitrosospira sp. NRS527 TaxID=155925 RepID=UPI001FD301C6|nr:cysteine hydrolase [Nitrosospira sp. NRS527]